MKRQIRIIWLIFVMNNVASGFLKNKYIIDVENMEPCPNNDKLPMSIRNIKYAPYNRTQKALSFDFVYDRPIDEKVAVRVEIDKWGDGGWRSVPFIGFQPNVCNTMNTFFKQSWVSFHKSAGVKYPDRCPIPAGNYSVKNYIMQTSEINIPFWGGRFRYKFMLLDGSTKELLYCTMFYLTIKETM